MPTIGYLGKVAISNFTSSATVSRTSASRLEQFTIPLSRAETLVQDGAVVRATVTPQEQQLFGTSIEQIPRFRLPLVAGDRYTIYVKPFFSVPDFDGDGVADQQSTSVDVAVLAPQRLDLEAGSFSVAVPVVSTYRLLTRLAGSFREVTQTVVRTDWYVRGIGLVKLRLETTDGLVIEEELLGIDGPTPAGVLGPFDLATHWTGPLNSEVTRYLGAFLLGVAPDGRIAVMSRVIVSSASGVGRTVAAEASFVTPLGAPAGRIDLHRAAPFDAGNEPGLLFALGADALIAVQRRDGAGLRAYAYRYDGTRLSAEGGSALTLQGDNPLAFVDDAEAIAATGADFVLLWSRYARLPTDPTPFNGVFSARINGPSLALSAENKLSTQYGLAKHWSLTPIDASSNGFLASGQTRFAETFGGFCTEADLVAEALDPSGRPIATGASLFAPLSGQLYPVGLAAGGRTVLSWTDRGRAGDPWCRQPTGDFKWADITVNADGTASFGSIRQFGPIDVPENRLSFVWLDNAEFATAWVSQNPPYFPLQPDPSMPASTVHVRRIDLLTGAATDSLDFPTYSGTDAGLLHSYVQVARGPGFLVTAWRSGGTVKGLITYPRLAR